MFNSKEITFQNKWLPFKVRDEKPELIRALTAPEGVADRLRLVAFAEVQARDIFRFGADQFKGIAPAEWIEEWLRFADVEERHAQMLLNRMSDLGADPGARFVSDKLWRLCKLAGDPILFLFLLSSAEERGMEAGFILGEQMKAVDAESAAVFAQIASEEVEHVDSAKAALAGHEFEALRERAKATNSLLYV
jgi:uncharacterized ferritin-like protein (DUF455 family)